MKTISLYILTFALLAIISGNALSQDTDIIITVKALGPEQYEDILFSSIEESQIVDFSNLLRVYINKSSVVMVDLSPVAFDNTGEAVMKILTTTIENEYGNLTPETIVNAKSDLKLLIKKSVFTNKSDFKTIMKMINDAIWGLQKHYSNKVYGLEYTSLTKEQKDNINKLIPLANFLAKDNEF